MNAFNPRSIAFAAKSTVAAIAAILAALWMDLPNPGWAGLTVFLVSQPLGGASGSVVSRSTYRVLGTLLGAVGILIVIPCFAGDPWLIPAVALWVGGCLAVSLLDRSPRAYMFVLAGYTLPLVGMSVANNPASAFNVALWRAEEILLGATFSTLVHTLFAPRSLKPALVAKAKATVADAGKWMLQGLDPDAKDPVERKARGRLAADLTEMRNLVANLRFEPRIGSREIALAVALEQRLVALLPLLAGIEARLLATGAASSWPDGLRAQLEGARTFIASPVTRVDALRLGERGLALFNAGAESLSKGQLLQMGAMQRLAELLEAWHDVQALLAGLEGRPGDEARLDQLVADAAHRSLHVDKGLAVFSGLAAATAVMSAGGVCWLLGWDQGGLSLGIAAAGSSLFAFADDPRPFLRVLLRWTFLAVPAAAIYVFAVFPALSGPMGLAVALAPLFFLTALYLASPERFLAATGFALISQSLLSLQQVQSGNFMGFVDAAVAAIIGTIIALSVISLVRVIDVQTSVKRLLRAAQRDLAALASNGRADSHAAWTSRMLDRVSLLLPRLANATSDLQGRAARVLDDLRLGVNIVELRAVGKGAKPPLRASIEFALMQLGAHFQHRAEQPDAVPGDGALAALDRVVAELGESQPGVMRTQGLTAACGLRLGLYGA